MTRCWPEVWSDDGGEHAGTSLLTQFGLTTASEELLPRLTQAALAVVAQWGTMPLRSCLRGLAACPVKRAPGFGYRDPSVAPGAWPEACRPAAWRLGAWRPRNAPPEVAVGANRGPRPRRCMGVREAPGPPRAVGGRSRSHGGDLGSWIDERHPSSHRRRGSSVAEQSTANGYNPAVGCNDDGDVDGDAAARDRDPDDRTPLGAKPCGQRAPRTARIQRAEQLRAAHRPRRADELAVRAGPVRDGLEADTPASGAARAVKSLDTVSDAMHTGQVYTVLLPPRGT